jgi:hypothetical protein
MTQRKTCSIQLSREQETVSRLQQKKSRSSISSSRPRSPPSSTWTSTPGQRRFIPTTTGTPLRMRMRKTTRPRIFTVSYMLAFSVQITSTDNDDDGANLSLRCQLSHKQEAGRKGRLGLYRDGKAPLAPDGNCAIKGLWSQHAAHEVSRRPQHLISGSVLLSFL